ncbi:protein phosphatase Slingshot homolog 1 isoform X2 [Erinaceus europaeus]|nr:protein phosphatase Slingshot homolog 1 isoform X2 [Erinaceus europaeus]
MINLLRCEDRIRLAVRLESAWAERVRYMVVVDSSGRQDTEESILLGVDFSSKESKSCTIGMVLRLWSDTKIHLDGDGGFSISTAGRMHVFKPVSVQAMWSALQVLHKACEVARRHNYFPGGVALIWAAYYESCIGSEQSCINEWNAMQDLESTRPDSPVLFVDKPTEGERTERLIKAKLRSIMMSQDLENVTSKEIRNALEQQMNCNLKEFKEFIDNEMLLILGQMDKPSLIFDHLYLGSEWNASNLEELQGSGVDYILNVTREIDNFFPGLFAYHNIRVYDEETTDLLAHWNEAYHFINKAKRNHSKCLVHCKMGVSRSASTVIAYAMKEFGWPLEKAYNYVKQRRSITRPNAGFMRQLSEYEGILDASKQRHNKLWRPQTESSLQQLREHGDFAPETLDAPRPPCWDSATQPSLHCCFRRLSDPLLRSPEEEPCAMQLGELEREALLEGLPGPHRRAPVRKKLQFGSPEPRSNPSPPAAEAVELEEAPGAEQSLLDRETLSNNSKRGCPPDLEHDAIFGILNKVKPPYRSCADCMYPEASRASEASGDCSEHPGGPAICTQPTVLSHLTSSPVAHTPSWPQAPEKLVPGPTETLPCPFPAGSRRPDGIAPGARAALEPPASLLEPSRETPKALPKSLLVKNAHCDGEPALRKDARPAKDLRLLFCKEAERPSANSYLMQHQESIMQLQRAGLVRKHTKELERLQAGPMEPLGQRLEACIPEESPEPEPGLDPEPTPPVRSPLPGPSRPDHSSHFSKDFLKTVCYTPTSSSLSSNLTRSSSSDSLHSVRGRPGLVRQRAQEIETRLRLAGLTLSSPLKRSHSLAKLGSLDFSTEDLSSEAGASTVADSQDAKLGEAVLPLQEPQEPLQSLTPASRSSGKSAPENSKSPSRASKS